MKLYKMWCEWDIGHEGYLFKSKEDGIKFFDEYLKLEPDLLNEGETTEDIWNDFIGLEEMEIYT